MNITIVGGGFGGVKAALELAKQSYNQITLITDKPDFQYYPALYSAATGHSHLESWVPLGEIFADQNNIHVTIDTVTTIDPEQKKLTGVSGIIYNYETCILALGTVTTYFGIKGLDVFAYGIKSEQEIKRLKKHLYKHIVEQHEIDKHYVVIGAGPTGVELAAALGSYINHMCKRNGLKRHQAVKIDLIEASPRVLPRMTEGSSKKVLKRLKKLGVNVMTNKKVEAATADDLTVSGKSIKSETVIWTSGVANNPFYTNNAKHFNLAKNGRVEVDEYMKASEHVYVIGDNAATKFTGLAQTALHDAVFVTRNFKRTHDHKTRKKYTAVMPPVVVPVGARWAVFEWRKIRLSGWVAAVIRRAADFIGYSDILPIGQALGVWRASRIIEEEYFPPTPSDQPETESVVQ